MGVPFCDYLDVTCSPEVTFYDDIVAWANSLFPVCFATPDRIAYSVSRGKLVVDFKRLFHRVSASGEVLRHLRESGLYGDYLTIIGGFPHAVTRLDAALDVSVDAPIILRGLEQRYPADYISFLRKALRVTKLYSKRGDGKETGTWYAGHRTNARLTARVYDKQEQAFVVHGESLPPTTRYELTFRKNMGCTLRDAYMPVSLFYEYASPALLDRPDGVEPWSPHGEAWGSGSVDTDVTFDRFRRRLESSPEVDALAFMAAKLGPVGVRMAVDVFRRRAEAELLKASSAGS